MTTLARTKKRLDVHGNEFRYYLVVTTVMRHLRKITPVINNLGFKSMFVCTKRDSSGSLLAIWRVPNRTRLDWLIREAYHRAATACTTGKRNRKIGYDRRDEFARLLAARERGQLQRKGVGGKSALKVRI